MNYEQLPSDTQIIPKELAEMSGCLFGIVKNQLREGVTKIIIEDGAEMVGWELLRDCTEITSVTIPDSVKIIADGAFHGCTSLAEINIPDTVTDFGRYPFSKTPWYESHTEDFFIVGDGVLLTYQGNEENVIVPHGVKKIGCFAFMMNNYISSVALPDTVTYIADHAFTMCENLEEITIPPSVTTIITTPIKGCFSGTPWFENSKEEFLTVGDGILLKYSGNDTTVIIPDNVKRISMGAFETAPQVEEISFGRNTEYIEGYDFRQTEWFKNYAGDFVIAGNILIDYRGNDENVIIPDNVKGIGECAIAQKPVKNVTIPDGVTFIGNFAFGECTSLESIVIPNSVKTIGNSAFQCCEKLESIVIPESVREIGEAAFSYCDNLNNVSILGNDVKIGMKAFIKKEQCVMPNY